MYLTPEAMSCSAKHSAPVPSTSLIPSAPCARAARSSATGIAPPALSLGFPPVHQGEIVRHRLDVLLGPQRPPSDHAVEHALPAPAVLAVIHPHSRAVALKAPGEQRLLARGVGESRCLRLLLLRQRGTRNEQRADQGAHDAR